MAISPPFARDKSTLRDTLETLLVNASQPSPRLSLETSPRSPRLRPALRLAFLLLSPSLCSCSNDGNSAGSGGDSDLGFEHIPKPSDLDTGEGVENPRTEDAGTQTSTPVEEPTESEGMDGGAAAPTEPDPAPRELEWERCGTGECTTIQVPVDYADPTLGTLGLRVFLGQARLSSRRGGVLFFNPGGPGAPVVADAADYQALFASYLPTMDIVLMDNRGMGQSSPTDCVSPAFLDSRLAAMTTDWTQRQVEDLSEVWTEFNEGCVDRMGEGTVSNLHSINVARDMDRVREALGEEKISVWNVSYGTVQASVYGKLFPERVSAFVLDSPVYFGDSTHVDDIHKAIEAYDNELSRFLAWCSIDDACGMGSTPAEVSLNYDALRATLANGVAYEGEVITDLLLDSVASGLLMYGEWETLAIVLNQASHGNMDSLVAAAMADSEDPEADHAMWQANLVVRLLDYGCPTNYASADALAEIEAATTKHPRMANVYSWHFTMCLGWETKPTQARIRTSDLDSAPFLIVTSAHDAATPLEGAQNLLAQLNNDSTLVVVEKEGHGVIGIDTYGTTRGVDFVEDLNPSAACSGVDCIDFEDLPLSNLPATKRPRPKLPLIKPRPLMPIVRL